MPARQVPATRPAVAATAIPEGELVMRTIAMPADTNANGDIFGGWLVSQMDLGGAVLARTFTRSRVVTVAIDAMTFTAPVTVGDTVTCYASLLRIGRTSIKIKVEVWAQHEPERRRQRVTEGLFTYVAVDAKGRPQAVKR